MIRASSETPPLARGRPLFFLWAFAEGGNTPACAGKTPCADSRRGPGEKHPRLRGEDAELTWQATAALETPPLARGRRRGSHGGRQGERNTPACAGKTSGTPSSRRLPWKHPRLRGEDLDLQHQSEREEETPPLARGRHEAVLIMHRRFRNTPACAGKTRARQTRNGSVRKHPRLRGEDEPMSQLLPFGTSTTFVK